uniref:Uncharacterized protein n=1 Tax=Sphenodon punctatus TaxID=8508 RepID=A0A8D0H464_SPHPU
MTTERERLKKMLSEGSVCEVQWESEFFSLQDNNNKLVAALHEANTSVDQWKKQLAAYQEETEALRLRVAELELQRGQDSSQECAKEEPSQALEELELLVKAKEEEIQMLRSQKSGRWEADAEREETLQKVQVKAGLSGLRLVWFVGGITALGLGCCIQLDRIVEAQIGG